MLKIPNASNVIIISGLTGSRNIAGIAPIAT